ncbi:MAG: protein ImuB, partial [Thermoleophilaceae bacterium]|nr:protein ImuB [Thermoleophilaceae bacterium]
HEVRKRTLPGRRMRANMCSMIACLQLPRFELAVAAGGREELLRGPSALAPEPGRDPIVGTPSAAAETYGVRAGMRLGEALARCPVLKLVPPDPAGVADAHDHLSVSLEGIGAAVEPGPPGTVFFDARALRHLHGDVGGVIAAARRAIRSPARAGAGRTRFVALAAASRARARRVEVVEDGHERRYLAPQPVRLLELYGDGEMAALPEPLERLGVRTLGELAALPRAAVSDRFGALGLQAHGLARGRDSALHPRPPVERLEESLELPESASGPQLERALELLIDRLLARRERRGRALRSAVVSAVLVEGGTWRERMTFREPLADAKRMHLVLASKLATLPAPAEVLRLRAEGFGPPAGAQGALLTEPATARAGRLREAIRQARAAAGPEAALRVLEVDPQSRVPERRLVLAPWET